MDAPADGPARQASVRLGRWLLSLVWGAALAVCVAAALDGGRIGVTGGSLLVVLVGLPGLLRLRRDALDSVGLYSAMVVVTFGLLSLLWLGKPDIPAPGVGRDEVARALLIVAAGLGAFLAAARLLGPAQPRERLVWGSWRGTSSFLLVTLFGAAMVITALGLIAGAIGYSAQVQSRPQMATSQLFAQGAAVGAFVVLICALQAFGTGDRRAYRLLPLLIMVQIVAGFVAGFKGQSVLPLLYTGLAYLSCTARVPWRPVLAIGLATMVILLPANVAYRSWVRDSGGEPAGAVLVETRQYASARFRLIDHVALIDARTPSVYGYGNGTRYAYLPALVALPRALWTEKPVLNDASRFAVTYWEVPPDVRTAIPLTQPGDLLRNFGVAGVLVGLAIWGLVVAALVRICRWRRSPRIEMVYIVSLVTWVTYVEQDLPTLIVSASRSLLVAGALAWLLLPGRDSPAGAQILRDTGLRVLRRVAFFGRRATPGSEQRGYSAADATPRGTRCADAMRSFARRRLRFGRAR